VIVTLFRFPLAASRVAEDLAEVFRGHRVLEKASEVEGCRGVYLAGTSAAGDDAYAVGLWDDETAYQRWLDHPERQNATDDIQALLRTHDDLNVPGQVLEVLHSAE
jgi:heme-degrading monooxygenase HmoA